jgi:hypothetical protein
MIPALAVIISVYCVMRLLWTQEFARVGNAGKPSRIYTVATVLAILVIVWQCVEILYAGSSVAGTVRDLGF